MSAKDSTRYPDEATTATGATMSDEQISELTGRLQRSVDTSLREMAEAIRGGECPGEAWEKVMSTFLDNSGIIPRREYDGMTHRQWWDDKDERSQAIINDDSGRYADSTKAAIALVRKEMKTPGNEATTDLGWRDYGEWIKRAEAGEVLDEIVTSDDDEGPVNPEHKEMREAEIEHLVRVLLAKGDSRYRAEALVLLCDEMQNDLSIVPDIARLALRDSDLADRLLEPFITRLRAAYIGDPASDASLSGALDVIEEEDD